MSIHNCKLCLPSTARKALISITGKDLYEIEKYLFMMYYFSMNAKLIYFFHFQFRIKDQVEWAFTSTPTPEQEDWITVDKSVTADAPAGIEKRIGFEGTADVGTGFYCHYQDGKLTDRYAKEKSAVE